MKLNADNPTILTGYGGFDHRVSLGLNAYTKAWLELGGVYVQTRLRGDGDVDSDWRKDGMLVKKQNTFNDFISVAEALIHKGYTRSKGWESWAAATADCL